MKLAEIKTILAGNPTEEQLTELKKDERAGVQKLTPGWSVGHCRGHFAGGRVYRRAERQQKAQ